MSHKPHNKELEATLASVNAEPKGIVFDLSNAISEPSLTKLTELPFWVGIGASAGGLSALKKLLAHLDNSFHGIVVVVQHLDPKHPTILRDLITRITSMPVFLVEKDVVPVAGGIYIISPGHNATLINQTITLTPANLHGPKPSINLFFNSMARQLGYRSIGVILSGTGNDGTEGLKAIKVENGITIAQDLSTAKYLGMPKSAIDSGLVDFVRSPEHIADVIQGYVNSADQVFEEDSTLSPQTDFETLFMHLRKQTGYDFSGYKFNTVERRVSRRMAVHNLTQLSDYVSLLNSSKLEVENLFKDLLISVSWFFRDETAFAELKHVIQEMVKSNRFDETIRIWVPACAQGEEAYSLVILFLDAQRTLNKKVNFQVFASDIDEFALSHARKAGYLKEQLKSLPNDYIDRYFDEKDSVWFVKSMVREPVVFACHNVIMDAPFTKLDLISCRNLLIYFSPELQQQVFQTFHFALKVDRFLFLGKSESPNTVTPELFSSYQPKSHLFVRNRVDVKVQRREPIRPILASSYSHVVPSKKSTTNKETLLAQLDQGLLKSLIPVALVLDDNGQIIHIRGQASAYLDFPQGGLDMNILSLIREDLKLDVKGLLHQVKIQDSAQVQALSYQQKEEDNALFLAIQRLELKDTSTTLFVLSFTQVNLSEAILKNDSFTEQGSDYENQNLRKEVAVFKARLQASIEQMERIHLELKTANEELQLANEEMQSSSEEMQTANEELQSTNQELSMLNQELEFKTHELQNVNHDLESILDSANDNIILLDNRFRILRFTQKAAQTFGLLPDCTGQSMTSLTLNVIIPNLRQELLNVIERHELVTLKIRHKSTGFTLKLKPYNAKHSNQLGVLLSFELAAEDVFNNINRDRYTTLNKMGDYLPFSLIVIDSSGKIIYANKKVESLLGYSEADLISKSINQLMPEPYASHHNQYLTNHMIGKGSSDVIGQWRDVSFINASKQRLLLKLKVEETWIDSAKHFLGFLMTSEALQEFNNDKK